MNLLRQVEEFIEDNDIRFIRLQFTDLFGANRNISISSQEFEKALKEGMPFRASAVPGFEYSGDSELMLLPDPFTMKILPWRPQQGSVARVLCQVATPDGNPFKGDSRETLIKIIGEAKKEGITFKVGAKIEFYLFELDESGEPVLKTGDDAGFFDLAPNDKGENIRREIIFTLEDMGFDITSSHHEIGPGQHEIDFSLSDPLTCADNIQTFKTVVKTISEQNGYFASFMPKPLNGEPGSGMHIIITASRNKKNLFSGENGKLSPEGEYFAGGILKEIEAIHAFSNPVVNSYKRLGGDFGTPENLEWKPESENSLIRVPALPKDSGELIIRNPDAAANPYLLLSLLLGAGLNGINEKTDPRELKIKQPATLSEAVEKAENNSFIKNLLGEKLTEVYLLSKKKENEDYLRTVHDWEIKKYFKSL